MKTITGIAWASVVVSLLAGCGAATSADGGTDAATAHDAGSELGTDAAPDLGSDLGSDAGSDLGSDAGSDLGTDAGTDLGSDAGSDLGTDAGTDLGTDAGPSCSDGARNGDETDVDCGGTVGGCPGCAQGLHCTIDGDCADAPCRLGICIDTSGATCPAPIGPEAIAGGGFTDVTTFSSDPALLGVGSIVSDGAGGFYAADPYGSGTSGDRLLHVDASGVATTLALLGGELCTNSQLTSGGGALFVYNVLSNTLQSVTTAGVVSSFSTVGGIGGGSLCTDSGVLGLLALPDDSFVLGSRSTSALYTLSADGATRATLLPSVAAPGDLAPNDATSVLAVLGSVITRVDLTPAAASPILDASSVGVFAVARDGSGDVYFSADRTVLRVATDGTHVALVARCFPGFITDLVFAPATSGTGTSLYVAQVGSTIDASDGDAIHELRR